MSKKRTQSQVGRASRRKGKSFERWCARYFTQWTGLKWETTRNSGRTDLKGDIYCVSRPDLPLIVECKFDKKYSVHAMLKPTVEFVKMFKKKSKIFSTDPTIKIMFIIKNDTGIWIRTDIKFIAANRVNDGLFTVDTGLWVRLQHITKAEIDGVIFDARRMESFGKRSKK